MAVNLFTSAYLIGNITNLLSASGDEVRKFRSKFAALETFMDLNFLPVDIRESMRSYMLLKFSASKEHREILEEFPGVFKNRIQRILYRPVLEASLFGEIVSDGFIDHLSNIVKQEVLMPDTDFIFQDDAAEEMYIILSGTVDILYKPDTSGDTGFALNRHLERGISSPEDKDLDASTHSQASAGLRHMANSYKKSTFSSLAAIGKYKVESLTKGGCVGFYCFLFNLLQPFSARTTSLVRLLVCKRPDWDQLKLLYPHDSNMFINAVVDELRTRELQFQDLAADSRERVQTGTSISKPVSRSRGSANETVEEEVYKHYTYLHTAATCSVQQNVQDRLAELFYAVASDNQFAIRKALQGEFDINVCDYDKRTALHIAAAKGTEKAVRSLIQKGAMLNCEDAFGNTPLFEAVKHDHDDVATLIFNHGGTFGTIHNHRMDQSLNSSMHRLVLGSRSRVVFSLLLVVRDGDMPTCLPFLPPSIPFSNASPHTSLTRIISLPIDDRMPHKQPGPMLRSNSLSTLAAMNLSTGKATPAEKDREKLLNSYGRIDSGSLLCHVAASGNIPFMTSLLKFNLDVNAADYDRRTPMHLAASKGLSNVVEVLLGYGGDVNALDNFGRTPLLEAIRNNYHTVAHLLHSRGGRLGFVEFEPERVLSGERVLTPGATVSRKGSHEKSRILAGSELCWAAQEGDSTYLRHLLEFGCPPNSCDYDARTAAHLVCCNNLLSTLIVLLEFKADFTSPRSKDRWGGSPLEDAERYGHDKIVAAIKTLEFSHVNI